MDLESVKKLIDLMNENNLVEIEYEEEGRKVKLKRFNSTNNSGLVQVVPIGGEQQVLRTQKEVVEDKKEISEEKLIEIKSPMVGTFYRSARPGSEPFVKVGDEFTTDKIICIIEAMKVMNEIKAEVNGVIEKILIENGQAVEFGQPMFLVSPKKLV